MKSFTNTVVGTNILLIINISHPVSQDFFCLHTYIALPNFPTWTSALIFCKPKSFFKNYHMTQNVYVRLKFMFMNRDQGLGQVTQGQSINSCGLTLRGRLKGNREILVKVLPEPINIFYWTRRKKEESSWTPWDFIKSCSSFVNSRFLSEWNIWVALRQLCGREFLGPC